MIESLLLISYLLFLDVVYDETIIPSLVNVLALLFEGSVKIGYIASTVRNEDTRDIFLKALGT